MDLGAWTVDMGRGPEAAVPKAWPVLGDAANAGVDESHGTHDAGSSVRRSSKPVQRYSSSGTEPLNFVLSCLCLGAFRSMQAMGPWARGPSLWQPGLTRTSSRSFDTSRAPLEAQQDSFGQTFSSSSSPSSPSSSSSSRKEKSRRARSRTCALVGDGGASLRGFFLVWARELWRCRVPSKEVRAAAQPEPMRRTKRRPSGEKAKPSAGS